MLTEEEALLVTNRLHQVGVACVCGRGWWVGSGPSWEAVMVMRGGAAGHQPPAPVM